MMKPDEYPIIRLAQVVDDDDSSKKDDPKHGAVQVRIFPELASLSKSKLPWAYPYDASAGAGTMTDLGKHHLPMKNSLIYVQIEEPTWRHIYYTGHGPHGFQTYVYDKWSGKLNIQNYSPPSYPEPQLFVMTDGTIIFYDRKTGDMGIQHSSGLYVFVDKNGSLSVSFVKNFTVEQGTGSNFKLTYDDSSGKFTIDMPGTAIVKAANIEFGDTPSDHIMLFEPLKDVLDKLLNHIHISPGPGPTSPALDSTQSPLSALSSNVQNAKSTIVKSK